MKITDKLQMLVNEIQRKADQSAASAGAVMGTDAEWGFTQMEIELNRIVECLKVIIEEHQRIDRLYKELMEKSNV